MSILPAYVLSDRREVSRLQRLLMAVRYQDSSRLVCLTQRQSPQIGFKTSQQSVFHPGILILLVIVILIPKLCQTLPPSLQTDLKISAVRGLIWSIASGNGVGA